MITAATRFGRILLNKIIWQNQWRVQQNGRPPEISVRSMLKEFKMSPSP